MSGQHARLSASSAHRWMECAGSVGPGGEPSIHAATGTFAHDIAAQCLKDSSLSPSDFFLKRAVVDGFDVECDMEMVEGIKVYLDAVDEDMLPGDKMWVEMPLLEALRSIDPDLGGTADYVRYRPSTQELLTADFKYGAGVYVDVIDNRQLKLYALGVLVTLQRQGLKVKQVRVMVCQPRYGDGDVPVREEVFQAFDLLEYAAFAQERAELTRVPNPPLVAGDHCKFCPKARDCKELEKREHALKKVDLSETIDLPALTAALADVPLVKERIRAIESYAYKLALQGIDIPGRKLVQKEGRRKWKREGDVIVWAQANAIDPYAPREVLSPAQLEEKVKATAPRGKKKEAAKVLEPFYEKVSSGTVLVPLDDPRPAVKRLGEDDFAAVGGDAKPALPQPSVVNLF